MIVVGAGMAGLLAGAMLRGECSEIIERQTEIPNNHSAVLRFRSTVVADVLNIPFKEVRVMKASHPWRNPVADAMAYSYKNTGSSSLRSITTATGEVSTRYIAPPNLIQRIADCVVAPIKFGMSVDSGYFKPCKPVISTIPMPILMKMLDWDIKAEFNHVSGRNIKARIDDMNAYFSLYVPQPEFPGSRISVTGDEMIVECPIMDEPNPASLEQIMAFASGVIGIGADRIKEVTVHEQRYAKILPIDDTERKRFILWATEVYNIYSLGRFATWRPGLLMDDVVNDVRVIHRLINGETNYSHK